MKINTQGIAARNNSFTPTPTARLNSRRQRSLWFLSDGPLRVNRT